MEEHLDVINGRFVMDNRPGRYYDNLAEKREGSLYLIELHK